jgi:hypothetical protein
LCSIIGADGLDISVGISLAFFFLGIRRSAWRQVPTILGDQMAIAMQHAAGVVAPRCVKGSENPREKILAFASPDGCIPEYRSAAHRDRPCVVVGSVFHADKLTAVAKDGCEMLHRSSPAPYN